MRIRQADKPAKAGKKPASADLEAGGGAAPASPNRLGTTLSVGVPSPVQVRLRRLRAHGHPTPAPPTMRAPATTAAAPAENAALGIESWRHPMSGRTISTRGSAPRMVPRPSHKIRARRLLSLAPERAATCQSPHLYTPSATTTRYHPPTTTTTCLTASSRLSPCHAPCTMHHAPCTQSSKDDGEDEPFWNVILGLLLVRRYRPFRSPPLHHYHRPTKSPLANTITTTANPPIDPRSLSASCSTTSSPGIGSIGNRWACAGPPRVPATYLLSTIAFQPAGFHRRRRHHRLCPYPTFTTTASLYRPRP
mmetsp:Transcript_75655/g.215271  ORF Transcript_75655/g.215271 Transcript_75655/m.215271 type:complete len:307 (+) Transcript_75655:74-994(+)